MNSPANDIKDILVAAAIGVFASSDDWGIFIGQEPPGGEGDGPDKCITIRDNGGIPLDTLNALETDNFAVQVRIRTEVGGYNTGWSKMNDIIAELNQKKDYITGSTRYASIHRAGVAEFLFRDDKNRGIFVCNFSGLRTTN